MSRPIGTDPCVCGRCKMPLSMQPYSDVHARTIDELTFRSSYAWCWGCTMVTRSASWGPIPFRWFGFTSLCPMEVMHLTDLATANHLRYPSGQKNYSELILRIALCFSLRCGIDPEAGGQEYPEAAWELAISKLGPIQAIGFMWALRDHACITNQRGLEWLVGIQRDWSGQFEHGLKKIIEVERSRLEALIRVG